MAGGLFRPCTGLSSFHSSHVVGHSSFAVAVCESAGTPTCQWSEKATSWPVRRHSVRQHARFFRLGQNLKNIRRIQSGTHHLLPLSDHNAWYFPAFECDLDSEPLNPGRALGNWGKKHLKDARWVRRGKMSAWGPGIEEWEVCRYPLCCLRAFANV